LPVVSRGYEAPTEGSLRWQLASDVSPPAEFHGRRLLVLEAFALRSLMDALPGFAVASGELRSPCLIRLHALEGGDPEALVADLDGRRQEALARRHRGEDVPLPDVPDRVTFRCEQRWTHVLTGSSLEDTEAADRAALLASVLRAALSSAPLP
jgi:hypothetical protein